MKYRARRRGRLRVPCRSLSQRDRAGRDVALDGAERSGKPSLRHLCSIPAPIRTSGLGSGLTGRDLSNFAPSLGQDEGRRTPLGPSATHASICRPSPRSVLEATPGRGTARSSCEGPRAGSGPGPGDKHRRRADLWPGSSSPRRRPPPESVWQGWGEVLRCVRLRHVPQTPRTRAIFAPP